MPAQTGNEVPRPSFWTDHCNRRLLLPSHETPSTQPMDVVSTQKRTSLASVTQVPTQEYTINSTSERPVGRTLPLSNNDDQTPAATNGAYSESLTRLQKGYLEVISHLESHNKALKQEIDNVASRCRDEEAQRDEAAQNYAHLEEQHSKLQQHHYSMYGQMTKELESLNQKNAVLRSMAAINVGNHQTIQEREEKIKWLQNNAFSSEDSHRRLSADLEAGKRRVENLEVANRKLAADLEAERKKDETIRTQSATIMAKTLKLIQVEEVHRRLQAALKEERKKNGASNKETMKNESFRKTIKEEDDMTEDPDERINRKNATIRDKNSQINKLKDAKQKLEEALKAERKRSRQMGKTSTAGVPGSHTHATAMKRPSEIIPGGPAQKKARRAKSTPGDANSPHVVEE